MQISKATSSIRRLFASLDIYHNNRVNTEVQKENESKIKKLPYGRASTKNFPDFWQTLAIQGMVSVNLLTKKNLR